MSARRQRGEGGISQYATASGVRYRIDWSVPVDPDDPDEGLKRRTRAGFPTKKLAAAALRSELAAVAEGRVTKEEDLTVAQFAKEWLAGARVADTTRAGYAKMLRLHVVPYIGRKQLVTLRPAHLANLYRDLETRGRADGGGGLGPNTVLKVHVLLGTILQAAADDRLIAQNPARSPRANPPSAREVKGRRMEVRPWNLEQTDRFLSWSEGRHWLHAAWITLAYTGLRRSELLGLQWGDIDPANGLLRVRRGVTLIKDQGAGERLEIGPPKIGRDRVIVVDADVVAALRAWRREVAQLGFDRVASDGWIFAADSGGPRHPERFSRIWRNAVGMARREIAASLPPGADIDEVLPITHVHGLRHAHAS